MVGPWSLARLVAEVFVLLATTPTLLRVFRSIRPRARLSPIDIPSKQFPHISVVIPARNEAARIRPLLESLRNAHGILEVIVVDDESTDETSRIAASYGAKVLISTARPVQWVGKTWALHQGIAAARGEWIVTLDADTQVEPSLLEALVTWAEDQRAVLTTVAGTFDCPTIGAQLVHPALLTTLIYRYGRPGSRSSGPVIANGQCMAFRRADAVSLQLMERVRGELIEDVALARALDAEGRIVSMVDGNGLLRVRMFEDFMSTVRGWGRSISMAGIEKPAQLLIQVIELACAQVLPIVLVVTGVAPVMGVGLLAIRMGTLFGTAAAYPQRKWSFWLSPAVDLLAWMIIVTGVVRNLLHLPVMWSGRSYGVRQQGL